MRSAYRHVAPINNPYYEEAHPYVALAVVGGIFATAVVIAAFGHPTYTYGDRCWDFRSCVNQCNGMYSFVAREQCTNMCENTYGMSRYGYC